MSDAFTTCGHEGACFSIRKDHRVCRACHDHDFWEEKVRWRNAGCKTPDGHPAVVIDGSHYTIAPDPRKGSNMSFCGMAGRKFIIQLLDPDETVIVTHNLWHQGDVPDSFRDQLTDNARFVGCGKVKVGTTACWESAKEGARP